MTERHTQIDTVYIKAFSRAKEYSIAGMPEQKQICKEYLRQNSVTYSFTF